MEENDTGSCVWGHWLGLDESQDAWWAGRGLQSCYRAATWICCQAQFLSIGSCESIYKLMQEMEQEQTRACRLLLWWAVGTGALRLGRCLQAWIHPSDPYLQGDLGPVSFIAYPLFPHLQMELIMPTSWGYFQCVKGNKVTVASGAILVIKLAFKS